MEQYKKAMKQELLNLSKISPKYKLPRHILLDIDKSIKRVIKEKLSKTNFLMWTQNCKDIDNIIFYCKDKWSSSIKDIKKLESKYENGKHFFELCIKLKTMSNEPNKKEVTEKEPWINEPDKKEFVYKGYKCAIKRNLMGCLLGYVYMKQNSKLSKYALREDVDSLDLDLILNVHGGITYIGENEETNDCVLGFDCGHFGNDVIPRKPDFKRFQLFEKFKEFQNLIKTLEKLEKNQTYKDINFVTKELESLVDQIIKYERELINETTNHRRFTR